MIKIFGGPHSQIVTIPFVFQPCFSLGNDSVVFDYIIFLQNSLLELSM